MLLLSMAGFSPKSSRYLFRSALMREADVEQHDSGEYQCYADELCGVNALVKDEYADKTAYERLDCYEYTGDRCVGMTETDGVEEIRQQTVKQRKTYLHGNNDRVRCCFFDNGDRICHEQKTDRSEQKGVKCYGERAVFAQRVNAEDGIQRVEQSRADSDAESYRRGRVITSGDTDGGFVVISFGNDDLGCEYL